MMYKIMCNPMHPLNDALPGQYVPVRFTRGALVAHRYTYALPRCRASQYCRTFVPLSVSLWNDLADPEIRWCGTGGFQEQGLMFLRNPMLLRTGLMFFFWPKMLVQLSNTVFP